MEIAQQRKEARLKRIDSVQMLLNEGKLTAKDIILKCQAMWGCSKRYARELVEVAVYNIDNGNQRY